MIYTFENISGVFTVRQYGKSVKVTMESDDDIFYLEKEDLYNLIGALHSLQTKIKKEAEDGRG